MTTLTTLAPSRAGFETDRLILRAFAEPDIALLPGILNDMEMCQYLALVPYPYTEKDAAWYVRKGSAKSWAITTKADRLIGSIGLDPQLGFWIAKSDWRKGYVTEAATVLLNAHFANTDTDVIASHALDNLASGAALRGLGFVPTHQKPLRIKSRNCEVPAQVLKLTQAQWAGWG